MVVHFEKFRPRASLAENYPHPAHNETSRIPRAGIEIRNAETPDRESKETRSAKRTADSFVQGNLQITALL
jgi:hypothetical protein